MDKGINIMVTTFLSLTSRCIIPSRTTVLVDTILFLTSSVVIVEITILLTTLCTYDSGLTVFDILLANCGQIETTKLFNSSGIIRLSVITVLLIEKVILF